VTQIAGSSPMLKAPTVTLDVAMKFERQTLLCSRLGIESTFRYQGGFPLHSTTGAERLNAAPTDAGTR
jgi:hypothetical protein